MELIDSAEKISRKSIFLLEKFVLLLRLKKGTKKNTFWYETFLIQKFSIRQIYETIISFFRLEKFFVTKNALASLFNKFLPTSKSVPSISSLHVISP